MEEVAVSLTHQVADHHTIAALLEVAQVAQGVQVAEVVMVAVALRQEVLVVDNTK